MDGGVRVGLMDGGGRVGLMEGGQPGRGQGRRLGWRMARTPSIPVRMTGLLLDPEVKVSQTNYKLIQVNIVILCHNKTLNTPCCWSILAILIVLILFLRNRK